MHDITEQIERITMMVLLLAFGGAIAGGLLADIGWRDVLAAGIILLVIRPLAGLLGMYRSTATRGEKVSIAFFGIRRVGSVYYLSYAINQGDFPDADRLWTILCLVVFASILIHGLTVTPAMRWLDRTHGRDA
ncbi:cation:proton antiporter [Ferranicluibacter rubi]|uniref:cation:proton antiporter domain-containing protein n=1 Tax=Ferranicluibacter rubi TaxID=2715133 RepID=UPI0031B9D86B